VSTPISIETNLPLVTIVTPSFNQAEFLEAAIRSVLSQDYPRIEYLVLDGGSTDGSLEIIQKFEDQIDYWHSRPDLGQADAINQGFRRARGEVVAWLNSDDVYLPGAISDAVQALEEHPEVGMVYGDGIMVDPNLEILDRHHYRQLSIVDLLAFEVLLQPATFMRKAALEEIGYLDQGYDLILDHVLWVRIAAKFPILHVPSFWALERTHPQAKTIAMADRFVKEAERLIDEAKGSRMLAEVILQNRNRIAAGLDVFSARRLIDAGKYRAAFRHLNKAILKHPQTAARYWYKWVQAGFSMLGLSGVFFWYRRTRRKLTYGGAIVHLDDPSPSLD
jgi:glycosyltransferase involved in cell wall biosynthesis